MKENIFKNPTKIVKELNAQFWIEWIAAKISEEVVPNEKQRVFLCVVIV